MMMQSREELICSARICLCHSNIAKNNNMEINHADIIHRNANNQLRIFREFVGWITKMPSSAE